MASGKQKGISTKYVAQQSPPSLRKDAGLILKVGGSWDQAASVVASPRSVSNKLKKTEGWRANLYMSILLPCKEES